MGAWNATPTAATSAATSFVSFSERSELTENDNAHGITTHEAATTKRCGSSGPSSSNPCGLG
ncbi:uncharacterized protein ColSpa_04334 [Colletotrichum spaethianum]|uniref:Uncharacterized protein n=1 Tax=Colletotrichum spaethianum TaxID=700344 RepID=A0AA37P0X4_9PEZI|nr:uncharacterized protein ColSpa_04334 [Colletotrichum spaethianum]GKT44153.1 hypothetical protein ColSpa_04334 [Colletotrichum spaethianum]